MKNALLLAVVITTQVLGDIWLSQGMKLFGAVEAFSPTAFVALIVYLLTSPWIWLGATTLVLSLVLYLTAISRLDFSFVLPVHASSYILYALLAWLILGEHVSGVRWLATVTIATGVFMVGWSEVRISQRSSKPRPRTFIHRPGRQQIHSLLMLLPLSLYFSKIWLGVLLLVTVDSAGDVLVARGMKQLGPVSLQSLPKLLKLGGRVLSNPSVVLGILCQTIAFLTFVSLLSWADISLIRPATALGYVVSLLGARYILKERITRDRLMGIIIIGVGVAIISFTSI